jgi:hypothetical protein
MYDLSHLSSPLLRLSENAHLPFDRLTALSKTEGLRYPHPSSLRRMSVAQGTGLRAQGNEKLIFPIEPCALCLKPSAYASFRALLNSRNAGRRSRFNRAKDFVPAKEAGWTFSNSLHKTWFSDSQLL